MKKLLAEIQDGSFAQRWIDENRTGRPTFTGRRQQEHEHQIESVGRELRGLMPFLDAKTVQQS